MTLLKNKLFRSLRYLNNKLNKKYYKITSITLRLENRTQRETVKFKKRK